MKNDGDRVLVLDHADSFAFILADQLARTGAAVEVFRADLALDALGEVLARCDPHLVVLSPGPGHPAEAATTMAWLASDPAVPVLGVCLGHQALALADGGEVGRAREPVHGRASRLRCGDDPLFAGLGEPLAVARYHSLVVTRLPDTLRAIATTDDDEGVVMAMRHRTRPRVGVQFHPESFLTPCGGPLLARCLAEARAFSDRNPRTVR